MFFSTLPTTKYQGLDVVNIVCTTLLQRLNVDKSLFFQQYNVIDGERPEMVAYKLYKRVDYHWVLLMINNIIDPYTDWLIASSAFDVYVDDKYKNGIPHKLVSSGAGGIHHFEHLYSRRILDDKQDHESRLKYTQNPQSIGELIIPITNYEYEKLKNDAKITINVINPRYVDDFVESYKLIFDSDR